MREDVLILYKEGCTHAEIAEECGLAPSTVGQYVYASKINKDPEIREIRARARIKRMIEEYEEEFNIRYL